MPHRPGPACTLRRSAVTVTPVYAGQNLRGLSCTVRDEVHDQAAGPTARVVVKCSAASTSARRRTGWLNVTTTGRPTPTVRPSGEIVARSTCCGWPVRTVAVSVAGRPSTPIAVACSVYVVRGTRVPVLAQRSAVRPPRTWRPSRPVRVTAVRLPPVTLTRTGLSSGQAVAPAAALAICAVGTAATVLPAACATSGARPLKTSASKVSGAASTVRGRRASTVGGSGCRGRSAGGRTRARKLTSLGITAGCGAPVLIVPWSRLPPQLAGPVTGRG